MKGHKIKIVAFGLVMVLGLTACGQMSNTDVTENKKETGQTDHADKAENIGAFPGTTQEDTVVLDVTSEPMEMNSMLAYDVVAMNILAHCVSGITRLDQDDKPVPELGERWEINEDSTVFTIYLRKDAKWSNGEPVTANDFYFSWVTQLKPETGSYMAAFLYENIKNGEAFYNGEVEESELGIKVLDDYTLEITWERPRPDGLFLLSLASYLPMNQKAYEEIGADAYGKEADQIVTNGAYRITEWVHDDHITLEKSEEYYNAANIQVPKAKLVMISDPNTRVNAFVTGEIDLCNLYSEQIAQIKDKDETAVSSFADGSAWYLGFNFQNEFLANKNLRGALSHSIDIQSLLDNVIADGSVAADGLIPGTIGGANGESYAKARGSLFAYDLEKAKSYMTLALEELGVAATDIQLTLDVANTTYSQNQAAYIQQQWKKNLGIEVTVNAQAWNAIQEAKWNGDFNISVEVSSAPENNAMSFLSIFTSDNANNVLQFANQEYDKLIAAANEESNLARRQELMIQAETILLEEVAVGPMYFTHTTYAISNKLEGLVRTPFQYFNLRQGAAIK